MSEEEDFDIVPDDELVAGPRSPWLWVSITAVVALFAFAVGVAFMIMNDRLGPSLPGPTPTRDLTVAAATNAAAIAEAATLTGTATGTATLSASGTPTATPTLLVTPTPTSTPTPACTQQVDSSFASLYNPAQFGCATGSPQIIWAAVQKFERGTMLWRSDRDTSYVLYSQGNWFPIELGWDGGPSADRGAPPPGLQTPQRGFGYVWSHDDNIFNGLGWARDQEKGFCALVQDFELGFMLRSDGVPSCTPENLYNFATASDWIPLIFAAGDNDAWRDVPTTETPPLQGGDRPPVAVTRPPSNGTFDARNATGYTIDGKFDEWPNGWMPMSALVLGADRHAGPGDLSANFQVGWNANGLLIAVRVNDDFYRPGPAGSDLWQGDSIELQFDRQLAEDFNTTVADADDYQVGIAFDNNLTTVRGYLWLPFEREAELALPGAVIAGGQGYQAEILIPWYVFDLDNSPPIDRAYGFNLSINDNDSDSPAQEIVLSASPSRQTHDNPAEWGTLRVLP